MIMSTLVVAPPLLRASLPLYSIEETLATFAETAEVVPPDQEDEFLQEFTAVLNSAIEKRDRMGQFMSHLEAQIGLAHAEIRRLQERKQGYETVLAKTEEYIIRVIQSLGTDAKGKFKKLEGNTITFSIRKDPPSVQIFDESVLPAVYQTASVTVKMPAEHWTAFLDSLDLEARAQFLDVARIEYAPSKTAIKKALEAEIAVPGAEIAPARYSLVRK